MKRVYTGHDNLVQSVAFSSGGKWLVSIPVYITVDLIALYVSKSHVGTML